MSKRIGIFAALAIGFIFTGSALACDSASGAVARIDAAKNTLYVSSGGCCEEKAMAFVLKSDTKVVINGKAATLADLRAGDKVSVDFEKMDDVLAVNVTRDDC